MIKNSKVFAKIIQNNQEQLIEGLEFGFLGSFNISVGQC